MTAQGRGGTTRDTVKPVREPREAGRGTEGEGSSTRTSRGTSSFARAESGRQYGVRKVDGGKAPTRRKPGESSKGEGQRGSGLRLCVRRRTRHLRRLERFLHSFVGRRKGHEPGLRREHSNG